MTRTLEKSQALETYAINGSVIAPFEVGTPTDKGTQIRQHLKNTTSLSVLILARNYLSAQRYSKPVAMFPTTSTPRRKPIKPRTTSIDSDPAASRKWFQWFQMVRLSN